MATPTVTGINPGSGPPGTMVVITGSNFGEEVYEVKFGTYDVGTNFVVVSETDLIAYVPSGTGTDLNVTVKNGDGTGTLTAGWDYATYIGGPGGTGGSAPTVTGIAPTESAYEDGRGGDSVVITGTKFATAFVVWFGEVPSPSFTIDSDTQITAIAPPGGGEVEVDVENSYGRSADPGTANDFTYPTVDVPIVTSISPTGGTVNTIVSITGSNFSTANSVTFSRGAIGPYEAGFTILNDSTIRAYAPEGPVANDTVDVLVSSPSGTATDPGAGNDFTYLATPTNLRIVPGIGHVTLFWDAVASASPVTYEVYGGASNPPTVAIAVTGATVMTIKQDYADGTKYYGVKTVDVFGNRSAMSNIVSGVALMTVADEIAEGAINSMTMFAAGIRPPVVVDSLPALPDADEFPVGTMVFLTTDRRLYRNSGGGPNTNSHANTGTWYELVGTNNGTLDGFGTGAGERWIGSGTSYEPYALHFDGTDDHVDLTAMTQTDDKVYTLEGWARLTTDCAQTGYIIWNGYSSGTQYCGLGNSVGLRPVAIQKDSSATVTSMPGGDWGCDDGNWHHYVATCDGSTQKIYLDAVLADSDTVAGGTFTGTDTTLIGRHGVGAGGGYWKGDIAVVRVYSAALTLDQINQNFKVGPTGEGYYATGLVAHWNTKRSLEADAWSPMVDAGEMSGILNGNLLIANSITAGQIAVGAIGASEIAADAIVSRQVTISNYTNLIPNPTSELSTTGKDTNETSADYEFRGVTTTNPDVGTYARRLLGAASTTTEMQITRWLPCNVSEKFRFFCRARMGTATTAPNGGTVELRTRNSSGGDTGIAATTLVTSATYGDLAFDLTDSYYTIPSGAVEMAVFMKTSSIGGSNYLYCDQLSLHKAVDGKLIVDGSITADHISSNTLESTTITGATIKLQGTTGGSFKTADSGQRIEITNTDEDRIQFYPYSTCAAADAAFLVCGGTSSAPWLQFQGPQIGTKYGYLRMTAVDATNDYSTLQIDADQLTIGSGVPGDADGGGTLPRTTALSGAVTIGPSRKSGIKYDWDYIGTTSAHADGQDTSVWNCQKIGTGANPSLIGGGINHPGVMLYASSGDANSGFRMKTNLDSIRLTLSSTAPYDFDYAEYTFQMRTVSTTVHARFGFADGWSTSAPANGAYLNIVGSGAGGVLTCLGRVRSGSTSYDTSSYTSLAVDTWYTARIVPHQGDHVDFYLYAADGSLAWSATRANHPGEVDLSHGWCSYTDAGTGPYDLCYMDYMNLFLAPRAR